MSKQTRTVGQRISNRLFWLTIVDTFFLFGCAVRLVGWDKAGVFGTLPHLVGLLATCGVIWLGIVVLIGLCHFAFAGPPAPMVRPTDSRLIHVVNGRLQPDQFR